MTGDEVRQTKFRESFRGYRPGEVDELLERVAAELDANRSPASLLGDLHLRTSLRGYNPEDVDQFLLRLRLET